ncbi:helix-turn-helix domain-containing protein [Streptomyces mirabilis]|uniref:helix-turn-helix domain-containing protein n=1 Tax=Streptomyces mirabilis TaxID=68239 RepID=UPI00364A94A8
MRRLPADRGLEISVGKMSSLWSGQPTSIRLDDLEVICDALGCGPEELLVREPGKVQTQPVSDVDTQDVAVGQALVVRPVRRSGRTAPP